MRSSTVPTWPDPTRASRMGDTRYSAFEPTASSTRRRHGCLGTLAAVALGTLLGAAVAVAFLAFANPQPRATVPVTQGNGTVAVTVDDAFLTTALGDAFQQTQLPVAIHDASAHCVPGDLILVSGQAILPLLGVTTPVTVTLQPLAGHGHLKMHVLSTQIGGLTLPAAADATIERALDARLSGLGGASLGVGAGTTTYAVTGVTTEDGHLTLTLGST